MANTITVADFETTTIKNDCRVWLWGTVVAGTGEFRYGTDISSFVEHLCTLNKTTLYFHNLGFDGSFLLDHLLKNGWQHARNVRRGKRKLIETLIDEQGKFYTITFHHPNGRIEIRDSLKKLPMTVASIAKAFNLPISKGEIDYDAPRPIGYEPTEDEIEYVRTDCAIVAEAIALQNAQGLSKLTVGADSLSHYKKTLPAKFENTFPILSPETDGDIRRAYKGGYVYAAPDTQNHIVGAGSSYDVNSLYPFIMRERPLPYGYPMFVPGPPKPTDEYPLWIASFTIEGRVKPGHLPCIQLKNTPGYAPTVYQSVIDEPTDIVVTNVDWKLIRDHYDIDVLACGGAYMFQSRSDMFDGYIDHWSLVKANSTGGMRALAKLMLNSLYGKFCTRIDITGRVPTIRDNTLALELGPEETRDPIYTPLGTFVTSWARDYMIRAAQSVGDRFLYCDTDSLHVLGTEPLPGIDVDPTRLGAWKHEYDFTRARYVRAKCYAEEMADGSTLTRIAGLPERGRAAITVETLLPGSVFSGKLRPVRVPGGIVLEPIDFTITA